MNKMTIKAKIKPWGNTWGITLPKKKLQEAGYHEGMEIEFEIPKKINSLEEAFGALPDMEEKMGMPLHDYLKMLDKEMESKF